VGFLVQFFGFVRGYQTRVVEEMTEGINIIGKDVYEYLKNVKRYGHRGQTLKEIKLQFYGFINEKSIEAQLERLKKGKYVRAVKIRYKKHDVIFYEVV
jgi:uncharacterized protein YlbG (UPF0298 family)